MNRTAPGGPSANSMAGSEIDAAEAPPGRDPELMAAAALGAVHSIVHVALARDPRPEQEAVFEECWAAVSGGVGRA